MIGDVVQARKEIPGPSLFPRNQPFRMIHRRDSNLSPRLADFAANNVRGFLAATPPLT